MLYFDRNLAFLCDQIIAQEIHFIDNSSIVRFL